ncbi:hypothetical protein HDG34_007179 [Paraburkholderia sp. HC6.4b]|uniref:hypothetical protein n=1 Tax=unclassified Paraburkholderia TaxID=2615204 RepID=UPI00160F239B|nr:MULTISPECIES: hypothetical protein [unclassified Paraburkholderia]MBB5413201.1 hypothetical protein [Paraburkholderia sp. HC6.4b]MBB5450378.1 hypothetical protein [Paraburkholderia sp. Kb1A]
MSEQLWCVHIEGLNDFIAVDSEESARYEASQINAYIDRADRSSRAARLRAVVVEWPFGADAHARALDDDWHDLQRMPHRQQAVARSGGPLSNLARRVRELLSVARAGKDDA